MTTSKSPQRMSDERLAEVVLWVTGLHGGMLVEAVQALIAERAHSNGLADIANTCAKQRDTARAIVDRADALDVHQFFNHKPDLSGRRFVEYEDLQAVIHPTQEPK